MRGRRKELNTLEGQINNFLSRLRHGENGCWNWIGGKDGGGYGSCKFFGMTKKVHRLSYELFVGVLDLNKDVCHTCDNPSCAFPGHLFLGTTSDNIQDMLMKNRHRPLKGIMNPKAKLDEDQVRSIRNLYHGGEHSSIDLGKQFNVAAATICRIVNRENWKHIGE